MTSDLHCYHCGTSLTQLSLPLGRHDECPACARYLHVCMMCEHYDPYETTKQCRDDDAEEVNDKKAANFCEYFQPSARPADFAGIDAGRRAAQELQTLFGNEPPADDAVVSNSDGEAIQDAEALFRK